MPRAVRPGHFFTGLKPRGQYLAFEYAPHGRIYGKALFADSRNITPYPAEPLGSREAPETAGDFGPDLDHPQIAFGEVVVERHGKITEEHQGPGFGIPQAFEQIPSLRLLQFPPFSRGAHEFRIFEQSGPDDLPVLRMDPRENRFPEEGFPPSDRFVPEPFPLEEERFHGFRPGDGFVLDDPVAFPQVVGVAEDVQANVFQVASPVVVHEHAEEEREYPHGFHGFPSAFRMDRIGGEEFGAGHVDPEGLAFHRHSRFVGVGDGGPLDGFLDPPFRDGKPGVSFGIEFHKARLADREPVDFFPEFGYPLVSRHLVVVKVTGVGLDVRAVLDGGGDPGGERGLRDRLAAGAPFFPSSVLVDGERGCRDVQHLPFLDIGQGDIREAPAASATRRNPEDFRGIRRFVREEGAPLVAGLPAPFLSGLPPQGKIRFGLSVSSGRGRYGGVGAVHVQPALEFGDLGFQEPDFPRLFPDEDKQILAREIFVFFLCLRQLAPVHFRFRTGTFHVMDHTRLTREIHPFSASRKAGMA